jgi:hypothetical protein
MSPACAARTEGKYAGTDAGTSRVVPSTRTVRASGAGRTPDAGASRLATAHVEDAITAMNMIETRSRFGMLRS